MAYATLSDVEAMWPLTTPTATTRATALLENAHALLAVKRRTLAADIAAGTVDPVLARMVIVDAVVRVLANPAGVSGQTLGPEAVQFTGVRTLGTVAFTQAELDSLDPSTAAGGVAGCAIGTARVGAPGWLDRERYLTGSDASFVPPAGTIDPPLIYADGTIQREVL